MELSYLISSESRFNKEYNDIRWGFLNETMMIYYIKQKKEVIDWNTDPVHKLLLAGTVTVNKFLLAGTLFYILLSSLNLSSVH